MCGEGSVIRFVVMCVEKLVCIEIEEKLVCLEARRNGCLCRMRKS